MNRGKLNKALSEISDEHIAEAAKPKRSQWRWLGPVAAVLAIVILVTAFSGPFTSNLPGSTVPPVLEATTPSGPAVNLSYGRLAAPIYPKMVAYPTPDNNTTAKAWQESRQAQYDQPEGYANGTENFFRDSIQKFLADCETGNTVCSPLNVYMALAMLAETANGKTRQQILKLLGSDSIEALRAQAGHVWNAHYCDDGATTLTLSNSLWLADWLSYYESTVNTLAEDYYASVYHDNFSDPKTTEALRSWLNEQTGDLLSDQVQDLQFDPAMAMVLASTIYYRAKWAMDFDEANNTEDVFHAPTGNSKVTFMHQTLREGTYYWGEDFTATRLGLEDGSYMWLILPDEGLTPAELLESGYAAELALTGTVKSRKPMKINLSLPKFDVVANRNIVSDLESMGIVDAFDADAADFTAISPVGMYVEQVEHAARVTIDEDGVVAAAYTVMLVSGTAAKPENEEIDFTLDRPFLFFITSRDDLPLFAGVVNQP